MSYENTTCPCGGKKERETMICRACRDHLAGTRDLATMDDMTQPWESRRRSAIRALGQARRRNKGLPLAYNV